MGENFLLGLKICVPQVALVAVQRFD